MTFVWFKNVAPGAVDEWTGRLALLAGGDRVVAVDLPGARRTRVEFYCRTQTEAGALLNAFGGQVRELADAAWQPAPASPADRPLSFAGGRLLVTGHPEKLESLRAAHPGRCVLCIPAAMAFGAGEHATTAMCLRFVAEEAARRRRVLPGESWDALDLGSGSGILALAARALGAKVALGLDNDPHAVRTAKENAERNGISGTRFQRADLLRWEPKRAWPVIAANLFSELHLALLPRVVAALEKDGRLIASGILRSQAAGVENGMQTADLEILTTRRRGKWVALLARKP